MGNLSLLKGVQVAVRTQCLLHTMQSKRQKVSLGQTTKNDLMKVINNIWTSSLKKKLNSK